MHACVADREHLQRRLRRANLAKRIRGPQRDSLSRGQTERRKIGLRQHPDRLRLIEREQEQVIVRELAHPRQLGRIAGEHILNLRHIGRFAHDHPQPGRVRTVESMPSRVNARTMHATDGAHRSGFATQNP